MLRDETRKAAQNSRKGQKKRNAKCKEICNGKEFQLLPICAFGIQQRKETRKEIKRGNKIKTFIYKSEVKGKQFDIAVLKRFFV